eukprot:NODE_225_length_13912_cov_0.499674.p2 type:complete len:372 gc:universal NODE_225_length_13912_cov_0.499674:3381-4496(+)
MLLIILTTLFAELEALKRMNELFNPLFSYLEKMERLVDGEILESQELEKKFMNYVENCHDPLMKCPDFDTYNYEDNESDNQIEQNTVLHISLYNICFELAQKVLRPSFAAKFLHNEKLNSYGTKLAFSRNKSPFGIDYFDAIFPFLDQDLSLVEPIIEFIDSNVGQTLLHFKSASAEFKAFILKRYCVYSFEERLKDKCKDYNQISHLPSFDYPISLGIINAREYFTSMKAIQSQIGWVPLNYNFRTNMDILFPSHKTYWFEELRDSFLDTYGSHFFKITLYDEDELFAYLGRHAYEKNPSYFHIYESMMTEAVKEKSIYKIASLFRLHDSPLILTKLHHYISAYSSYSSDYDWKCEWYKKMLEIEESNSQ